MASDNFYGFGIKQENLHFYEMDHVDRPPELLRISKDKDEPENILFSQEGRKLASVNGEDLKKTIDSFLYGNSL